MDFGSVFIVAIVFIAVYKIIEVLVHRKERINLVEKIDLTQDNKGNINQILGDCQMRNNWATRIGCLLVGIGLGVLLAYFIVSLSGLYCSNGESFRHVEEQISTIYISCAMVFGGAGLLVSHFIEKKQNKEK